MRVALIGNMNNNYFALMRYMRDMGVDAELLMYKNEGAHFAPENDTTAIEKWAPFIKQTNLNGGIAQYYKLSADDIRKEFGCYDYYIGCGFTPAYFYKAGMQLDLFTPYCVGIEYTYRITKTKPIHYIKEYIEAYYQKKGLVNNTKLLGTIDEESRAKALKLHIHTTPLPLLMIYNKEAATVPDNNVQSIIDTFDKHYPVVFSHVSHYPSGSVTNAIKRNDILIKGFAKYTTSIQGISKPLLVLFDYGKGVVESKELIKKLGIEDKVLWLPLMSRKYIMQLLKHVHFGGGEFGGAIWGGTAWEFMAAGVPFFQYVSMDYTEFERKTGMKMPEFINTNSPDIIADTIGRLSADKMLFQHKGAVLKDWFNANAGERLAEKYIQLLKANG